MLLRKQVSRARAPLIIPPITLVTPSSLLFALQLQQQQPC